MCYCVRSVLNHLIISKWMAFYSSKFKLHVFIGHHVVALPVEKNGWGFIELELAEEKWIGDESPGRERENMKRDDWSIQLFAIKAARDELHLKKEVTYQALIKARALFLFCLPLSQTERYTGDDTALFPFLSVWSTNRWEYFHQKGSEEKQLTS